MGRFTEAKFVIITFMPAQPPKITGFSVLKATITPDLKGMRLDKVLVLLVAEQTRALSRVRVQALIKEGLVARDGKPVINPSAKVKADEIYSVHVPPPEPAEPVAQKIPLTIVYEDDDLLVIDKPAGMVVHPAPGNRENTLVNALLAHCGTSLSGIGGVARPGIVHRLDKDTSGLMVVAKNDAAHQALSRQFSDRSLSRTYHAIVWGTPVPSTGKIEGSIGRSSRDRKKMAVVARGKSALTRYRVLETFGVQGSGFGVQGKKQNPRTLTPDPRTLSLIECKLATGRTHQIRVHLAHRKYPVVGDAVYGRRKTDARGQKTEKLLYTFPRQALHAIELKFRHPRTGKLMRFKSKLPADMAKLLRRLRAGKL